MYRGAQIRICSLLCIAAASLALPTEKENSTARGQDCPVECICLSPKQVLCNTGGLTDIPTRQLPSTVEELSLTKNNFPVIGTDAFAGLRMLGKLTLDGNNITSIRQFAFRGLSRLRELSIQHTPLPYVGQFSFATLQNVTAIFLANNKIRYIEGYAFAGTSNVRLILLSNNPLLTVETQAFSGLTNVERLIFPSGIRVIKPDAFHNLQYVDLLKLSFMDLGSLQPYTFRGLCHVRTLYIQESDLGVLRKNAFAGMSNVENLYVRNNKIDLIEQLHLRHENAVTALWFHGNHVLEAPRHAGDVILEVRTISASRNHFPCDCQAHAILESDFVNGSGAEFRQQNYCISPIEYNGRQMSEVDFDEVARCHDKVVQDNLGSGVLVVVATSSSRLFLLVLAVLLLSTNFVQ